MNAFTVAGMAGILALAVAAAGANRLGRGDLVRAIDFESADALQPWTKLGTGTATIGPGPEDTAALTIERPADDAAGATMLRIPLPVEHIRGLRLRLESVVKAEAVSDPPQPWNGVKFMLHTAAPDRPRWAQPLRVSGSFDWKPIRFVATVPSDATEAWLYIGLEETAGRVSFGPIRITVAGVPHPRPPKFPRKGPVFKGHSLPRLRGAMVNPQASEEDLRTLGQEWNANLIRWQLNAAAQGLDMPDPTDLVAYNAWLESALQDLDQLLPACEQYGIMAVVDLHTAPGGAEDGQHRLFRDPAYQEHFLRLWDGIARRYKGRKAIWGYDLLNEPMEGAVADGLRDWHTLAETAAKRIRAIDRSHAIIVEPSPGADPSGFDEFFEPIAVPGVVYSVHMYLPHTFTGQGIHHARLGVSYPGDIDGAQWDRSRLEQALQPVVDFQRRFGVHIYVGEFSAVRWAPGNSTYTYLSDLITLFERNGWDWTYHAFREFSGWSVEHGNDINDAASSHTPTRRQQLLESWFQKNQKPPFARRPRR